MRGEVQPLAVSPQFRLRMAAVCKTVGLAGELDRARIVQLHARELSWFREARPRSLAMIARARGTYVLRRPGGVDGLRQ
jgi:hypothetical protein